MTTTFKEFQAEIAKARNQKPFITYLVGHDGCRFMHVSEHDREAILSKSSEAQKVTLAFMEKLGWKLESLDIDGLREMHIFKRGEFPVTIARGEKPL